MVKSNQLVFLKGKEKALDALFKGREEDGSVVSVPAAFGYLALGYNSEINDNGFEDPDKEGSDIDKYGGFKEITDAENYERIELQATKEVTRDPDNGQIIKKYQAELPASNVTNHPINQFAICDSKDINNEDTVIYSAASFNTFNKTAETSITFIVGFKI